MEDNCIYNGILFLENINEIDQYRDRLADKHMLAVVVRKQGRLQFEQSDKIFTLGEHDILVCFSVQLVGHYLVSPDFKASIILIDMEQFRDVFRELYIFEQNWWHKMLYFRNHPVFHIVNEDATISLHIEAIAQYISHFLHGKYSAKIMHSLVQVSVCILLSLIDEHIKMEESNNAESQVSTNVQEPRMSRAEQIFAQFLVLLNRQPPRPRFSAWYASQLCVTVKYLNTICQRVSGKTATRWINEAVIEDIRHMLLHSGLSIKEISVKLDFPNLSFFGKFVKQHLGSSPTEYRKRAIKWDREEPLGTNP